MKEIFSPDFYPSTDPAEDQPAGDTLMEDIKSTADRVHQFPPYLRTQSSAARAQRDLARSSLKTPEVEERYIDSDGQRAQGSPVGNPAGTVVEPLAAELMSLWRQPNTGQFSGERHHGQPGDPGYIG